MTTSVEGPRTAEFLISEAEHFRSRDVGTIDATGGALDAGTILGRITLGAAVAVAKGGNTGNATVSAVTRGPGAKVGVYSVDFTAATKFDVTDPDGFKIKSGSTGVAYADDLGFTITAGATPMVAGDGFNITVAAGAGKYKRHDPAAVDGSQVEAAVLFEAIGAVEDDRTVVARAAAVKSSKLIYAAGANDAQKAKTKVALEARGIIVR
ncbi:MULTISPECIES: head decoration protein [unclassified Mesorhizobium]|uniref:head decoration protein n=1 Tax=unclassified Mesorhizobium TaxID=325217 RepID=UPI001126B25D|nr:MULTISPECIES: head decoration protein [unclassified Mesorhizobium]MCA0027343.1 head decoration protein [Mesorhizobium sp. B263B1A]TPJ98618.1 head decoration protein [Mesorhizobium sp. B2-5-12]TPK28780.1 head decoration protein [Mesorhizobium sp. B2-5-6]